VFGEVYLTIEMRIIFFVSDANGEPSADGLGILLSFSLARGHLANVIKTLILVKGNPCILLF
jgi:hypothetical protein